MDTLAKATEAIRREVKGAFKPCAYYVERLDMVVFITEDCSTTLHEALHALPARGGTLRNHHNNNKIVGCELYGIRGVLREKGLEMKNGYLIRDLVYNAASLAPCGTFSLFGKHCGEMEILLRENNVPVHFS